MIFQFFYSPFFPIKLQSSVPTRDPWYLSLQTEFRPAAAVARSRLLKRSSDAKRTVRNNWVLMIFQFFYSPFFPIKLQSSVPTRDPWYLSLQTEFSPAAIVTCSRLLKQRSYAKRTVRNDWVLIIFQFVYSPFFQLNCYFWGKRVICDISAHRQIFATLSPSLARVYWNRAAPQKERWETICFGWFFSSFTNLFFN